VIDSTTGFGPRLLAALVCCAAAVACSSPAPPPAGRDIGSAPSPPPRNAAPPPDAPAPQVIVMTEPEVALPSRESFRLLDPGTGARVALRYRPAAGAAAVIARTALTSRQLDRGEFGAPVALPVTRDGFAITVAADHPGQLALRGLTATAAAGSDDAGADAYLAAWRTLLQDRRVTVEVDARGAVGAIRFDDDPAGAHGPRARDELVQRLLALIVPLPDEPVGPGARWRVVTILRQGPAVAKQTATYTLISRTTAAWKLHVQLHRVGEPQRIADPSLPAGTTADLVALFRSLEGDVDVDPTLPLIAGGSLAIESRLHARLAPRDGSPIDQMFEDIGRVSLVRCRPARAVAAGECPDGFSR
jgi:hypothetical protein